MGLICSAETGVKAAHQQGPLLVQARCDTMPFSEAVAAPEQAHLRSLPRLDDSVQCCPALCRGGCGQLLGRPLLGLQQAHKPRCLPWGGQPASKLQGLDEGTCGLLQAGQTTIGLVYELDQDACFISQGQTLTRTAGAACSQAPACACSL